MLCIENDLSWANLTQQDLSLELSGGKIKAKVVYAPLIENKVNDLPFYDMKIINREVRRGIDLLIIDGPWDVKARDLAFLYLGEKLSETAVIVLDDGDSPVIRDAVNKWCNSSKEWRHKYYPTVKGTWVIYRISVSDELPMP